MLAKANRIVRGDDYRAVVRRGMRTTLPHAVVYRRPTPSTAAPRFGFIVAKNVGNAVHRNLVRRRLKAIAASHLHDGASGDIVVRALPGSAETSWVTLSAEISGGLNTGGRKV